MEEINLNTVNCNEFFSRKSGLKYRFTLLLLLLLRVRSMGKSEKQKKIGENSSLVSGEKSTTQLRIIG